jgi:hypothetical protein
MASVEPGGYDSGDLQLTMWRRRSSGLSAGRAKHEAVMRIVSMIGATLAGLLLASCASVGPFIGDKMPAWAGGLPVDAPPRRGDPGYEAYMKQIDGEKDQPATAAPAQTSTVANPPAPQAHGQIDQPVH